MKRRGKRKRPTASKEVNEPEDQQNRDLGIPITDLPSCISLNILVRLPVKRIFVCKRVCKTWRALISSPDFAKLHFARGQAFPLIRSLFPYRVSRTLYLVEPPEHCLGFDLVWDRPFRMNLDTKLKIPLYDEESVIESVMRRPPKAGVKLKAKDHEFKVVNSCNGLLCLCEPSTDLYNTVWRNPIAVCNPITGEYINLPAAIQWDESRKCSISIHCGLGFSPKMNEYKVIRIRGPFSTKERDNGSMTEIHTVGTGSWKRICNVPSSLRGNLGPPTYLNGSLHWICDGDKDSNCIMSYDFDNEKFQSLPPPPFKLSRDGAMSLGVLRGSLCICDGSVFEVLNVWVMEEYGIQGSWSKEFCLHDEQSAERWFFGFYEPMCCLRNGAILVFDPSSGGLFYQDSTKPGFKFLKLHGSESKYEAIAHIPSFISLKDALKGDNLAVLNTKSSSMMDQFPSLRSGKSPKNSENLKNPNSSSEMNVLHVFSPKAAPGVIPVKLLDILEEVSSPVVPIPAPADDPCPTSSKPKWVDVVAPFSCDSTSSRMNLSYFPPQLRDSKVVVCPPQDVVDQGSDLWTDCIVGYFLDKKVPFPIVKNIVMRIWEKFGIYDVRANDQGFFFFKFSKVDAYRSLMETGPFTVDSPLLDVVEVEYANGSSAFVATKYPWKPSRCSECHVFGHTEALHKVHVVEVGAKGPPPVLSSPEQEVGLPSDESIDQAVVSPVEPVLYASESLGQVPFPTKPYRSPSVGILLAQGNTVVMTDGVASGLSVSGRGLVEMVPHSAIRSQGSPVNKASPVTLGLGMNRCSNTFSILETTLPDDTAFQEELLQQGGYLLDGEGSGNAVQAIEALDQADSPNAIGLVVTPPQAIKKKGRGRGAFGQK
ncbi:hypothetical protein RHGRI_019653 [Rhododendron griersonianum]|uniref:F-box domain-containing protein n=1 Tax=Rhododendron griersonianum TaxID=479676 RepID=A0AAV6JFI3_9ERIC|nr:hypothetical protein RHGRI_019653 [Rhododendron griersonianum]